MSEPLASSIRFIYLSRSMFGLPRRLVRSARDGDNGSNERTSDDLLHLFRLPGPVDRSLQIPGQIEDLRRCGRPIAGVHAMKSEEAVVCSLTGSPAEFNEEQ